MLLQQAEAVGVDRPDEQARQPVECGASESLLRPALDSLLELIRCPLGERERDDRVRGQPVGEQIHDPLRNDFGLAGTGRSDDLDVSATVAYCLERGTAQLGCWTRYGLVS